MEIAIFYSLVSILMVSAVSLIGAVALAINKRLFAAFLPALIGLAAGALLGDSFIHLIPESIESIGSETAFAFAIIFGLIFFFILEKLFRWHHAHHGDESEHEGHDCEEHTEAQPLAPLVITADALHNIIDGALIAASYLVSIPLGIATTIAVFLHEIPQEIADYALLVHSGFSHKKALVFNFLSALTAFIGAGLVFVAAESIEHFSPLAIAFTAGGFIYIAAADLIPELHKSTRLSRSIVQTGAFVVGIGIMFALTMFEV